ncbi:MAG: ABC transporter substrate-binding protein [Oscillospiraceae bacterium]|jgi:iron complex transport system substrate-binding protein|nr:ABC transporter substrate-binding protein [Oscillospiraceae bacterium]
MKTRGSNHWVIALVCALSLLISGYAFAESQSQSEMFSLAYPPSLQEQFGEGLLLDATPQRLIVMTPNPVLAMYEMGLEMLAVPISQLSVWPDELKAERLPLDRNTVDMEGILLLQPDFVILSTGQRDAYGKTLEERGIPCYYVKSGPAVTFQDIREMIQLIGAAFGKTEITQNIMGRFDAVEAAAARYKAEHGAQTAAVMFSEPGAYLLGSKSYLGSMLDMMGYLNIADQDKPASLLPISMEELILQNPQAIFVTHTSTATGEEARVIYEAAFEENAAVWGKLDAISGNNVVYLGASYSHASGLNVISEFETLLAIMGGGALD